MKARVAVFISGGGTNLQALLDRFRDHPAVEIGLVISDRPDAGGLERARAAGVPAHVVPVMGRPTAAVAADTLDALDAAGTDVVALAGYLRLLPADVVARYRHRILNIHPALLPAFGGKGMYGRRVHEAVLESGARVTGATVHMVTERYDEGRIVAQWPVPVLAGDSPARLAERVLRVEHVLYPAAVEWLARLVTAAGGRAEGQGGAPGPPADAAAGIDAAFRLAPGGAPEPGDVARLLGID